LPVGTPHWIPGLALLARNDATTTAPQNHCAGVVGKYEVDGANGIVTDPEGKQIVFTKTAEGLEAQLGILGKMTCKKL
jgi:hypothetical protein